MNRCDQILGYWFGRVEQTVLPSADRARIWFSQDAEVDEEIKKKFSEDMKKAIAGSYTSWEGSPRGSLALIILFDQFSRNIYRGTKKAFTQDPLALEVCLRGIEREYDHSLSLVERAFYYMPFMHSEDLEMQATSVRAYKILVDLSFPEGRTTFESFLDHAIKHYEVIKTFGRFPTRNEILQRESTSEEYDYLKNRDSNSMV